MSDKIKTGGPAFPRSSQGPSGDLDMAFGMELRDWFAGMAMQAVMTTHACHLPNSEVNSWLDVARGSYRLADAMLTEREKGIKP